MVTTIFQPFPGDLKGRVREPAYRITASPAVVSISTSSARNPLPLVPGRYFLKSDIDGYAIQGDGAVTASASSWYFLAFEELGPYVVTNISDGYFAARTVSGTGSLFIKAAEEM